MMNSITKKLVSCALCIALGVLLPMAFHVIPNAGSIFLPMHIPVLICGLFCGWPYGLACGIITPFLSSVMTCSIWFSSWFMYTIYFNEE